MNLRKRIFLGTTSLNALAARMRITCPPIRFGYVLRDAYRALGLRHLDRVVG